MSPFKIQIKFADQSQNMLNTPYSPIMANVTRNQAALRCGVAADAELLRPAMLLLVQNSCWPKKIRYLRLSYLPCDPKKVGLSDM